MKNKIVKKIAVIYLVVVILAFVMGVLYGKINLNSNVVDSTFFNSISLINFNTILIDISVLSMSVLFSPFLLGTVMLFLFLFYHMFLNGLVCFTFVHSFGISGIYVALSYFFIYKILLLLLLYFIIVLSYKIFLKFYLSIKNKINLDKLILYKYIQTMTIFILFLFIYNFVLLFLEKYLLIWFSNVV